MELDYVQVDTQDKYDEVLSDLHDRGYTWFTGSQLTLWGRGFELYKEDTVIIKDNERKRVSINSYNRVKTFGEGVVNK